MNAEEMDPNETLVAARPIKPKTVRLRVKERLTEEVYPLRGKVAVSVRLEAMGMRDERCHVFDLRLKFESDDARADDFTIGREFELVTRD